MEGLPYSSQKQPWPLGKEREERRGARNWDMIGHSICVQGKKVVGEGEQTPQMGLSEVGETRDTCPPSLSAPSVREYLGSAMGPLAVCR